MRQVVLDPQKVFILKQGRWNSDIAAASGHTLTAGALRRIQDGKPIRVSLATHVAKSLGVELTDIVIQEVET